MINKQVLVFRTKKNANKVVDVIVSLNNDGEHIKGGLTFML